MFPHSEAVTSIIERLLLYRAPALWATHAALAALAYLLAFYIDGEFFVARAQWTLVLGTLPLLLLVRLGTFVWFHLFEGLWRYVSMRDMRCGFELGPNGREVPAVIYFA
jgi:hypothetical protein